METLKKEELIAVEGGHISTDTSYGHDIGYIAGLAFRYSVVGFFVYEVF
jgi:hypothetical protein